MPDYKMPTNVRKACLILGLRSESMTLRSVLEAWKLLIINVRPDAEGDGAVEAAISLNTAKDTIIRWLDAGCPAQPSIDPFKPKLDAHRNVIQFRLVPPEKPKNK